ncbi:MAG TPA: hypothetical protein VGD94_14115 [Vicinamibacterales bacterium]
MPRPLRIRRSREVPGRNYSTPFAKGARAILDADRNLFDGRHVSALKGIFRRRGIGPVD